MVVKFTDEQMEEIRPLMIDLCTSHARLIRVIPEVVFDADPRVQLAVEQTSKALLDLSELLSNGLIGEELAVKLLNKIRRLRRGN